MSVDYTHLHAYCERAGDPALLGEPLNAVTNAAFLLAAVIAWKQYMRVMKHVCIRTADVAFLIIVLGLIGLGSLTWHTAAAPGWTVMLDVIPILTFMNVYLIAFLRRVMRFKWRWVWLGWGLFFMINAISEAVLPADMFNGSIMYLPAWLTIGILAALTYIQGRPVGKSLSKVLGIFTLSLVFRTLDLELCDWWAYGTHPLWHILNAIVLYRLTIILMVRAAGTHRSGASSR
jgi:hypothetical protein